MDTDKGGVSTGVCIAMCSHVEAGLIAPLANLSPLESFARLIAMLVKIGRGFGIVVLSAYLWHSEFLSFRNRMLVLTAIAQSRYFGGPWIAGGGLLSHARMQAQLGTVLDEADAYIVVAAATTHQPTASTPRTIDYFIVSLSAKQLLPTSTWTQGKR